ncbi:MAG: RNA-guided endonuclease IscB [Thermodesulfovibrionales bacterium]|jgi:5-methylcytosine-specific restriction endonuclease McrA
MKFNRVFVLDKDRRPLAPCRPARARKLLTSGEAAVLRRYPFTIILKIRMPEVAVPGVRLKVDPGSKVTGLALVCEKSSRVVFAAELGHRGQQIKNDLESRRALRRSRRNRKTRYRAPRFDNRRRPEGWLAPSLNHRVETTMTWVGRFLRLSNVQALSVERVKFDTQAMQNPEISGVQYQQGELMGYEVREYLLEKWGRHCAYCGAKDSPLEIEHVIPRSKGGSNKVSNLTLACNRCNTKKGNLPIEEFLKKDPARLEWIKRGIKASLKESAAVNATRNALFRSLLGTGLSVETGTGGRTKFNRCSLGLPKAHWIDAACVGESGEKVKVNANMKPLAIAAKGHGNRQMCGTDKFGFPIRHRTRRKQHFGFQTGDMVRACVPRGKSKGVHTGRVLCRARGSFDIKTKHERVGDVSHKNCTTIHRSDGYEYN